MQNIPDFGEDLPGIPSRYPSPTHGPLTDATLSTILPFPRWTSLKLPSSHRHIFPPLSLLLGINPLQEIKIIIMELANFMMLLVIVAIINAAPVVDVQRRDDDSVTAVSERSNVDGVELPGAPAPSGTSPNIAASCVPTAGGNRCSVVIDEGSANCLRTALIV